MGKQKKSLRAIIICLVAFILLAVAGTAFLGYRLLYAPDFRIDRTVYVYIDPATSFDKLCTALEDSAGCSRMNDFRRMAAWMKYPENMKTGRYAVAPGMTHRALLTRLRNGQQTPVRLTFNNIRLKDELAARLADQLMLEPFDLLTYLNDPAWCDEAGFTAETVTTLFIPNTYEVYWNIPPDRFLARMKQEYDRFWTDERKKKAQAIHLTPVEVSILASIVEEETAVADEYKIVAGLYLNRLKRGVPLQADPTVKYAVGDFTLRRILNRHLEVESPYNTYLHTGLPPGPIRIPSIRGIDGVLDYMKHNYMYMCAKEDFSGRHNFAVTLAEHNRNAERYRAELNRRNIR